MQKNGPTDNNAMPVDASLSFKVNDVYNGSLKYTDLGLKPVVKITLSESINSATVNNAITLTDASAKTFPVTNTLSADGKTITVTPQANLTGFTSYVLGIASSLQTASGGKLTNPVNITPGNRFR
ncbi:Ig-like domain-containing protein [Mucilaginibacter humi]|uniref:Ig-like domain-containing protein n=1 Tax=Mucilaginibacter humi TaxID=2732510 RepID=UPI001FECA461|nr:Ig-like domain-containing protein [Mucilaginibacter humi]